MNVLLVGGFGYLGGRLATGLRARGHEVVVAGRRVRAEGWLGFRVETVDVLAEPEALAAVVRKTGTQAIVDLAALDENEAIVDPDMALRVSGEGVRRLLSAARLADDPRLVFMSTFHVYGARVPASIDEDTATKASHPYATAHLAGEGYCRESNRVGGPQAVVLRMSNGYGCPADLAVDRWTLAHNDFCRQAVETGKITLTSSGVQRRDFVWMDDVAQAVDLVLRAPSSGSAPGSDLGEAVFNVGGGRTVSIFELATVVAARAEKLLGCPVTVERPSQGGAGDAGQDFHFSIDRLRALGYAPSDRLTEETDALLQALKGSTKAR